MTPTPDLSAPRRPRRTILPDAPVFANQPRLPAVDPGTVSDAMPARKPVVRGMKRENGHG